MRKLRPSDYDGIMTCTSWGMLVKIDEPRWWQFWRRLKLLRKGFFATVDITQCGQTTTCRAQLPRQ